PLKRKYGSDDDVWTASWLLLCRRSYEYDDEVRMMHRTLADPAWDEQGQQAPGGIHAQTRFFGQSAIARRHRRRVGGVPQRVGVGIDLGESIPADGGEQMHRCKQPYAAAQPVRTKGQAGGHGASPHRQAAGEAAPFAD